jgi:hypothetical protein
MNATSENWIIIIKQVVCHIVALPFTLKNNLRQKEEFWKFKY